MGKFEFKELENKYKNAWHEQKVYEAVDFSSKPKKYILSEFPYPSGAALHMGHMMRFSSADIYSRFLRMKGYNVLFPMGWDAFGLPAENYAVKTGIHPKVTTKKSIDTMKSSLIDMGFSFDWDREISTIDPEYYKWTQWLFLKFYENNLAEYKEMPIWWCDELKTVLAEEEVLEDSNGNKISERGGHPVVRKNLKQWILKITSQINSQPLETQDENQI
jgi:leucyl-tRNA synthetase